MNPAGFEVQLVMSVLGDLNSLPPPGTSPYTEAGHPYFTAQDWHAVS